MQGDSLQIGADENRGDYTHLRSVLGRIYDFFSPA